MGARAKRQTTIGLTGIKNGGRIMNQSKALLLRTIHPSNSELGAHLNITSYLFTITKRQPLLSDKRFYQDTLIV